MQDEKQNQEKIREIHHHYYQKDLNFGKLFLGFLLIVIGFAYFAKTAGWIDINFNFDWWQLWPILIIFAGLSMFSARGWFSMIIGIIITFAILGMIIAMFFGAFGLSSKNGIYKNIDEGFKTFKCIKFDC